jgi:hypothetical protein
VVYLRPVKRARVTSVPNSASKRSRRGATAMRLKIMWKKLRCVRGNRLSRCTVSIAVSFGGSLAVGPILSSGLVLTGCVGSSSCSSPHARMMCVFGVPRRRIQDAETAATYSGSNPSWRAQAGKTRAAMAAELWRSITRRLRPAEGGWRAAGGGHRSAVWRG